MSGTFVGWLWGNSYCLTPALVTPYLGNAICIIVWIGSMIALKVRYPNAWQLMWLSNVGCNHLGHPLIYDQPQNRWINDSIYGVDTIQMRDDDDDDDDSTDNSRSELDDDMDDVDIEVGHHDRDQCDDEDDDDDDAFQQQEMTSLVDSMNIPNSFRSRRSSTVANGN